MKPKYLSMIVIFTLYFAVTSSVPACPPPPPGPPVAVLQVNPSYVPLDCNVALDGRHTYWLNGAIKRCEWDWDYDPNVGFVCDYNESPTDKLAYHIYTTAGMHTAALRVTNVYDFCDIATCQIEVVARVCNLTKSKLYGYIQSAVDEANDFDIIEVKPSVYNENVDFKGKKIILKSIDPNDWSVVESTIISASNSNESAVIFGTSENANSIIAGFRITNGSHGIECNDSSPIIRNCIIERNGWPDILGGGIYNYNASPWIINCFIVYNDADYGAGIYNAESNAVIHNCFISNNVANYGGGIHNRDCSPNITNCTITNNHAYANGRGGGVFNYGPLSVSNITNCIVWDNNTGNELLFWGNNPGNEIFNDNSAMPCFSYCNIKDSNGSGNKWWGIIGQDNG
ncbi:MAG: right-handed parallel beta-helix repeat-containing protein, partial [Phycisphaerae bacterium]|nr:right-handed parallel beta-helix repeat-containing protein [Phycisphaerae bacterium]